MLTDIFQQGTAHAWLFLPSAVVLGALHGLEPGHSKTMMAAFIVAVRGTVAQAVLLALCATLSHTLIVWVVALGGLYLWRGVDVQTFEPYLQVASGASIVAIALWILWRARRERPEGALEHDHGHANDHGHAYVYAAHSHDPGHDHPHAHDAHRHAHDREDAHALAHAREIRHRFASGHATTGQIVMFGLTGGLIPCGAAVTVLLLCLQVGQLLLGAVLVLCFSIGLALTLVAFGAAAALGVQHATKRLPRFAALASAAPYLSSVLILSIGVYVGYEGLAALAAASARAEESPHERRDLGLGTLEVQMMTARQEHGLDLLERRDHLSIEIGAAERALLGEHHEHGRLNALDERADLLVREPHLGRALQALVRVPLETAIDLAQRAAREDLRGRGRELRETARALRDRGLTIREHAAGLASELAPLAKRARERRGRVRGHAEDRHAALDQHDAVRLLGKRGREQHRDRGAARMAEQVEALPAEPLRDLEHVADVFPDVVSGVRGAEAAAPVAREIERDELALGHERREQIERARVVEPTVQREHRCAAASSPNLRREREPGQCEFPLLRHGNG